MNPNFNIDDAMEFVGKHVVIEQETYDENERLLDRLHLHGNVVRVSEHEGVVVRLHPTGDEYRLPPDGDIFREAPPGEYAIEATGEVVRNPDLMLRCIIHRPPPEMDVPPVQALPDHHPKLSRAEIDQMKHTEDGGDIRGTQ